MSHDPSLLSRRQVLRGGVAVAAGAALAPALIGCTAPAPKPPTGSAAATGALATGGALPSGGMLQDLSALEGKKLAHFVVDASTPVSARSSARGKQLAEQYGFTLEMFDAAGDFNKVNSTLSTWAAKGIDGIIDTGVDPTPIKAGIDEVTKAGIPIGGVYAGYAPGAGLMWDVTTNEWINFGKIGTYVLDRIGDSGGGVAIINWPEVPVLRVRSALIHPMMEFYEVPILADEIPVVPGQVTDTKNKVAALLAKYPEGAGLSAVIAGWDEIGIAAAQAIQEAGRDDVFVVASDGLLEAYDMIRTGAPFAATCGNDIEAMTDTCYAQLATLVSGGDLLATTIYVDAPLVTAQNVPPEGTYAHGAGLLTFYVK